MRPAALFSVCDSLNCTHVLASVGVAAGFAGVNETHCHLAVATFGPESSEAGIKDDRKNLRRSVVFVPGAVCAKVVCDVHRDVYIDASAHAAVHTERLVCVCHCLSHACLLFFTARPVLGVAVVVGSRHVPSTQPPVYEPSHYFAEYTTFI